MSRTMSIWFVPFAVVMFGLVVLLRKRGPQTREGFYVADRKVGIIPGAMSVAVSWVWAPALFVASSIAYDLGLAGALWFIVPNVACFFIFAPIAVKMRETVPEGYTLPGYFRARYPKHHAVAVAFSITASLFMMTAIASSGIVPIVFSVFWKKQTSQASFWSLVLSAAAGIIISIGGHFYGAKTLAALGAPIAVAIGLVVSITLSSGKKSTLPG